MYRVSQSLHNSGKSGELQLYCYFQFRKEEIKPQNLSQAYTVNKWPCLWTPDSYLLIPFLVYFIQATLSHGSFYNGPKNISPKPLVSSLYSTCFFFQNQSFNTSDQVLLYENIFWFLLIADSSDFPPISTTTSVWLAGSSSSALPPDGGALPGLCTRPSLVFHLNSP